MMKILTIFLSKSTHLRFVLFYISNIGCYEENAWDIGNNIDAKIPVNVPDKHTQMTHCHQHCQYLKLKNTWGER